MSLLRSNRAMTLLEIMLALLVLAMVIFMVSLSLSGSLRVIDATRAQGEIYFRAQIVMQRISEDLASALLVDGFEFVGETGEIDGRRTDSLAFTSTAHVVFDPEYDDHGIALISYRVVSENGDEGELVLLRGDNLLASRGVSGPENGEKSSEYLLSDSLRSVRFTYFDETGEEHDTWTTLVEDQSDASPRKLPVSVQCTLDFWLDRENESSLEFSTRILLPVGLINAERT